MSGWGYWGYLRAYYGINRETEWTHGRLGRIASLRDAHRLARRIARCTRQERRAALAEGAHSDGSEARQP